MNRLGKCLFSFILIIALVPLPAFSASVPAVKPGKGLVVFYRPKLAKGGAIRFEIVDIANGPIGQLKNGTTIYKDLAPGSYTFKTRAPSVNGEDTTVVNVEAGKTYYVKGEIIVGWPTWRPKFNRVDEAQAKADLAKMQSGEN